MGCSDLWSMSLQTLLWIIKREEAGGQGDGLGLYLTVMP